MWPAIRPPGKGPFIIPSPARTSCRSRGSASTIFYGFQEGPRDIGTLAVQARLAYDPEEGGKAQFQLYNAYFRYKAGFADIWAGHSRPALGLSSVLDSHALLLPTLAMTGYGFDRDWGVGIVPGISPGETRPLP